MAILSAFGPDSDGSFGATIWTRIFVVRKGDFQKSKAMDEVKILNVWAGSEESIGRRMSNLAATPIFVDGLEFASVEAFISWLVTDPAKIEKRDRIRSLWGRRAKTVAPKIWPNRIEYHGNEVVVDSAEFYELVKRALRIKLETYPDIAEEFIATRPRPLRHDIHGVPSSPDFLRMIDELREEFAGVMGEL